MNPTCVSILHFIDYTGAVGPSVSKQGEHLRRNRKAAGRWLSPAVALVGNCVDEVLVKKIFKCFTPLAYTLLRFVHLVTVRVWICKM